MAYEFFCPKCGGELIDLSGDLELEKLADDVGMTFKPMGCGSKHCDISFVHMFLDKKEEEEKDITIQAEGPK